MRDIIGAAVVALARGGLAAGAAQTTIKRVVPATLCAIAGAILAAAAIGCAVAALWIYVQTYLGAVAAAAISALVLLFMALVLFGAAFLFSRRKPPPSAGFESLAALAPQIVAQVAGTAERLKQEAAKLPKEHGVTLLMAALLAGLAAEQSLRKR